MGKSKRLMALGKKGVIIGGGLKKTSELYRYVTLNQFLSMVERKKMHLTRVISWEDPWELPSLKIPTKRRNGKLEYPKHSYLKNIYGQCWSLNSKSDALWRIYSSRNNGILLHASVENFLKLDNLKFGFLAPVIYYSDLRQALAAIHEDDKYKGCYRFFGEALLKRESFKHEAEVRLLVINNEMCLGKKYKNEKHIELQIEPLSFIKGITIDPRASDWFVNTIDTYCRKNGFKFTPRKSKLYSPHVFAETKVIRKYIPVKP